MQTFTEHPFPSNQNGQKAIREIYKLNKSVFLCIARSVNGNVMVYKANVDDKGHLVGIDMFWLDLEPSYMKSARKRGRNHDRDEIGILDTMVYGIDIINKESPTTWQVKFKKFQQVMTIHSFPDKTVTLFRERNKRKQKVFSFFIHVRSVIGYQKVDQVDVTAFNIDNKQVDVETIIF